MAHVTYGRDYVMLEIKLGYRQTCETNGEEEIIETA